MRFRVGPESAGAKPGPACYRGGGPLTVTDCNLFLGRIVPEEFPGPVRMATVCDILEGAILKRRAFWNRPDGVAIIAEGLLEHMPAQELESIEGVRITHDSYGHLRLAEVDLAYILKNLVEHRFAGRESSIAVVHKNIGYELRSAAPVAFDCEYVRTLGYGALADAASKVAVPTNVRLRKPPEWRLLGRDGIKPLDVQDLIHGRAQYGLDTRRDGMLFASVERATIFGATVKSFDPSDALKVPGVKQVVEVKAVPDIGVHAGVAVIATIDRLEGARENVEKAGLAFESVFTKRDLGVTE